MIGPDSLRILVPSIVDPTTHRGGAGTVTRTLFKLLQYPPLNAQITPVPPTYAPETLHRLRQFSSLTRSLLSPLPSKAEFTHSGRFLRAVQRLLREHEFDLVLLNGSDLLWLLPVDQSRAHRPCPGCSACGATDAVRQDVNARTDDPG
jgi:hypothetical protein